MPLTKNSLFSPQTSASNSGASLSDRPAFVCDRLLWIGDSDHFQMHAAWQVCRTHCDAISHRSSLNEAIGSPPRQTPTHVIVAQTNRHGCETLAIDGPALGKLRSCYPNTHLLVLRNPLVAPTVRLPRVNSPGSEKNPSGSGWVESISSWEAIDYLPHWLMSDWQLNGDKRMQRSSAISKSVLPIVIVASRYSVAEALIDSLAGLCTGAGGGPPLIQWQRELTRRSATGFATVLWDESAAPPTTPEHWRGRCQRAAPARHVWITATANWQQRQIARENGIDTVLEKPGRLECLIEGLAVAPERAPER